jgi:subtilisin family serine protease
LRQTGPARVAALAGFVAGWGTAIGAMGDPDPMAGALFGPGPALRFDPRPRILELSGRLLARPLPATVQRPGESAADAQVRVQRARARLATWRTGLISELDLHILQVPPGTTDAQLATQLLATGDYQAVTPDWRVYPSDVTPNDPDYPLQWHLPRIAAPAAWTRTTGSSQVTLAFVDTGLDTTHPDLQPLLVPGYNAVDHLPQSAGGQVSDVHGHGTTVAGSAAAVGNNAVGGCGVGWGFGVMPVRCTNLSSGAAYMSAIIEGIVWAASHGAKVVSVSYTGLSPLNPSASWAGTYTRLHGGLLVWAMDNSASDYGSYDPVDVIAVSGTDRNDGFYTQSSYGQGVSISAPSVDIYTTERGGGYGFHTGCSYAAPIVAGTVGLVWSVWPSLTPSACEHALLIAADDLGPPGRDPQFGWGRVNAARAVEVVNGGPPDPRGIDDAGQTAELRPPDNPFLTAPGVRAAYYDCGERTQLPDFGALSPIGVQILGQIDFAPATGPFAGSGRSEHLGALFDGFLRMPADGAYTLYLNSSDGSRLWIGDTLVVDNDLTHPMQERSGTIGLQQGNHRVRIGFFDSTEPSPGLIVSVSSDTLALQPIPPTMWRWAPSLADINRDGRVNTDDFLLFLSAYANGDPAADLTGDGVVDLLDLLVFMTAYSRG